MNAEEGSPEAHPESDDEGEMRVTVDSVNEMFYH